MSSDSEKCQCHQKSCEAEHGHARYGLRCDRMPTLEAVTESGNMGWLICQWCKPAYQVTGYKIYLRNPRNRFSVRIY